MVHFDVHLSMPAKTRFVLAEWTVGSLHKRFEGTPQLHAVLRIPKLRYQIPL